MKLEGVWGWVVDLEGVRGGIEASIDQNICVYEISKNTKMLYWVKQKYIILSTSVVTLECNRTSEIIASIEL